MTAVIEVGKYNTGKVVLELASRLLTKDHQVSNQDEEAVVTGKKEKGRS